MRRYRRIARDPRVLLVAYAVLLAAIAFWPTPVDAGAARMLRALAGAVPWATHARVEFAANIVLFLPFGVLLGVILRRPAAVLLTALAISGGIELVQALVLSGRTATLHDVLANVAGAALGALVVTEVRRHDADLADGAPTLGVYDRFLR